MRDVTVAAQSDRVGAGRALSSTVVVGYDGTPPSRAAVRWAQARAADGRRVVVVHAIGLPPRAGLDSFDELLRRERERGAALLAELAQELGLGPELRLVAGDPAPVLIECARGLGASEIVVGARGRYETGQSVVGSVCSGLLLRSEVPVVVVAPSATMTIGPEFSIDSLLVVDDPDTLQGIVARPTARIASAAGAKVAVLPLESARPSQSCLDPSAGAYLRADLLANIIRRAAGDIEVESMCQPAPRMYDVARVARTRGVELIVVGARRRGSPPAGRTVAKLLEEPPCAVMVVPSPVTRGDGRTHTDTYTAA
jgi:nucleotide-binding universal stress UspA family protein